MACPRARCVRGKVDARPPAERSVYRGKVVVERVMNLTPNNVHPTLNKQRRDNWTCTHR